MTLTNADLFYCYSKQLNKYINKHSNIKPLTLAINPKSGQRFSLYYRSNQLEDVLDRYRKESVTK